MIVTVNDYIFFLFFLWKISVTTFFQKYFLFFKIGQKKMSKNQKHKKDLKFSFLDCIF
jgi:hypothetical protein